MSKYSTEKERYSNFVTDILIETGLISAEESPIFRNYILSVTV
jgi:hypothetical protein